MGRSSGYLNRPPAKVEHCWSMEALPAYPQNVGLKLDKTEAGPQFVVTDLSTHLQAQTTLRAALKRSSSELSSPISRFRKKTL